jgi:membrane protein implicated in regulation of membrane protease activity
MDWNDATTWWIAAGVLVAAELATGTFYLLMLALGATAAALAAHGGLAFGSQLLSAAIVGGGAVAAWHFKRGRQPAALPASANRDVNLDIGETVHVTDWDAEGNAQVTYRGANWAARFAGSGTPRPGSHVIRAVDGNRLLLEPSPPAH